MKKIITIIFALIIGLNGYGQSVSNKEVKKNIDDLFESYSSYNRFIGNVLISQNDTIIYQKSFGFANLEEGKKNNSNAIFSVASLTKSLTAVGIMKLVEDGKLTLETPVSNYFPDFMPDYSKDITIQHLLNNSSGMEANIGRIDDNGNGLMPEKTFISLDELLEKFKDYKLNFEPGTSYEYNNFGYLLLANIIEMASGQPYANYMEQAVFRPANMKNTASASFTDIDQRTFPYLGLGMNELKKVDAPLHTSWLMGAADINSTTLDLYNFLQALDKGIILKPATVNRLYGLTQDIGVNEMKSGLGWVIGQKEGEEWIYNNGLLPGYASMMGSMPSKNIKVIILSNATSINPIVDEFQGEISFVQGEITDKIISLLLGKSVDILPLANKESENLMYVNNTYQFDNNHSIRLKKEGNEYVLETEGKEPWSLFSYTFSRDAKENNPASETAIFFANAMSKQNFEGLSFYGNNDMKAFLGSDEGISQLKGMWNNFLQHAGEFHSFNIYKIEGEEVKNVSIRFHFDTIDIGIVLSIDSLHKIQGMFMDDALKTSHISKVSLVSIGENKFFINGHENGGMQDLKVNITEKELVLIDGSKSFNGKQSGE
jgi:CubicO group peptidase (beta-lactamase class C family)